MPCLKKLKVFPLNWDNSAIIKFISVYSSQGYGIGKVEYLLPCGIRGKKKESDRHWFGPAPALTEEGPEATSWRNGSF